MTPKPKPRKPGLLRRAWRAESRFFAPFLFVGRDTKVRLTSMSRTAFSKSGPQQFPTMRIPATACYNKILLSFVIYLALAALVYASGDLELAFLTVPASLPLAMGVIGLVFGRRPGVF
ncbi:MAG: hypothetical protein PHI71_09995 [Acidiphilium sp.]|jgi:hypothetical protein|nr:hypothetical protein [Acidiphilium sp.]